MLSQQDKRWKRLSWRTSCRKHIILSLAWSKRFDQNFKRNTYRYWNEMYIYLLLLLFNIEILEWIKWDANARRLTKESLPHDVLDKCGLNWIVKYIFSQSLKKWVDILSNGRYSILYAYFLKYNRNIFILSFVVIWLFNFKNF